MATKAIVPRGDNEGSLGTLLKRWAKVYAGEVVANITGDVTGDLTGNVTGNVSGSSGSCTGNSVTATTASSCSGNAATATKATNDADGNAIKTTYAKLASPTFTGIVVVPDQPAGDNSTKAANTKYVAKGIASTPCYYSRSALFAPAKTTIITPSRMWVNIALDGYIKEAAETLDLTLEATWDSVSPDYRVAATRAGKDFYVYACVQLDGTFKYLLSANSTVPAGYTADNSRKVGGFHCLCVNVGTITGHTLTGYVAGDILPASVWDLSHRPTSATEGMVYDSGTDVWVDIYLASYSGSYATDNLKMVSAYGGVTADGTSTEKFHWHKFSQVFATQKKRLLTQREFVAMSIGSNQSTNILGSADPNTTGGHKDTTSRRMISNIGVEDACGALWQWGCESGGAYGAAAYVNAYDANDKNVGGQSYNESCRAFLGGYWGDGVGCGSRGSYWAYGPLILYDSIAGRGASEPKKEAA